MTRRVAYFSFLISLLGWGVLMQRRMESQRTAPLKSLETDTTDVPHARNVREIPTARETTAVIPATASPFQPLMEAANAYIEEHRSEWGIDPHHELEAVAYDNPVEPMLRYGIRENGYLVWGMTIDFRFDGRGRITQVDNGYRPFNVVEEKVLAVGELARRVPSRFTVQVPPNFNSPPVLYVTPQGNAHLAFVLPATIQRRDGETVPVQLMVRASDGQVLQRTVSRGERR